MIENISYFCIGFGIFLWFWGTFPLLGNRSVLFKLHGLSVADTIGSMSIVVGLLLRIPSEWPLLVLALISLAIWNTVLGYVLAYCSRSPQRPPKVATDLSNLIPVNLETVNLETREEKHG